MKILVVSAADATNLSIENVVKEFIRRGHVIDVFSPMQDEKTIRMFKKLGLNIFSIDRLKDMVQEYDIAFIGTDAMEYLRFANIYVFGYNFLFNGNPSDGADFMFTLAKDRKLAHPELCAVMPMGVPKNDTKAVLKPQKQFLYIDAGHIPFGDEGKRQVAKMLLEICDKFPEYNLVVKPRWLLSDRENLTHANKNHIYDVINDISRGKIPSNLIMLNEHKDMQELMDESQTVITTSISCFVDSALRKRNCLVVGDLSSEDQHEMRLNKSRAREYQEAEKAGVLVSYKNITSYLPKGKQTDENYINDLIAYKEAVSEKIVDVVEWVFENYIAKGKYPRVQEYSYEEYKKEIRADDTLNINTLIQNRMFNGIIRNSRKLDYIDAPIDFTKYYEKLEREYKDYTVTSEGYRTLLKNMDSIYRKTLIENAALLEKEEINQSILLQACFDNELYDFLISYDLNKVLCKGPYFYWVGRTLEKIGSKNKSAIINCYLLFLKEANNRTFEKYNVEHDWGMVSAYNYVFLNFIDSDIEDDDILYLYHCLIESGRYKKINRDAFENIHQSVSDILVTKMSTINVEKFLPVYIKGSKWGEEINHDKMKNALIERTCCEQSASYRLGRFLTYLPHKCVDLFYLISGKELNTRLKSSVFFSIFDSFLKDMVVGYKEYAKVLKNHNDLAKMYLNVYSTGDVFISNGYYATMLNQNNSQEKSILVTPEEGCYQTTGMFDIKYSYKIEREQWLKILSLMRFVGEEQLNAELLHYDVFIVYTGCLKNLEGYGKWNLHSLIKEVHFPTIKTPSLPVFDYTDDRVNKIFDDNQLKYGKTVVLAPYAKWSPKIIGGFWEKIALELKKLGYSVCTNSVGELEPPIEGTAAVSYPYDIAVPFIEKAGYIIGLRSGFLDIIESAKAKKVALYPFNCVKRGIANGSARGSFSLNAMFGRNDWLEIETNLVNLKDVIIDIIDYFGEE